MDGEQSLEELAADIPLRKQLLSEAVAMDVLKLFKVSVSATVLLTLALAAVDAAFIAKGIIRPSERLISETVLMSIIGASLVQVGAGIVGIIYALFSKPASEFE